MKLTAYLATVVAGIIALPVSTAVPVIDGIEVRFLYSRYTLYVRTDRASRESPREQTRDLLSGSGRPQMKGPLSGGGLLQTRDPPSGNARLQTRDPLSGSVRTDTASRVSPPR